MYKYQNNSGNIFTNWLGVLTADLEELVIGWKINYNISIPSNFIVHLIDKKLKRNESEY